MAAAQFDVFISYRRATGNQLASLIKVLLQLRGYEVFMDVDQPYAGKFDARLLKNIETVKNFILVLTPNSLDPLLNDKNCDDWIHKELKCAFDHGKNVIPIFDQHFKFPQNEDYLPSDIRNIATCSGIQWRNDYYEACLDEIERRIEVRRINIIETALPLRPYDVFISYRRATGNQLASLIKVLLQLRGYKVFIDLDQPYVEKFDASLLKNIQAAKHFILVLTPNSLDRLLYDHNCDDWIHKELKCAFDHGKNVIPIFDQNFKFPQNEDSIPSDICNITKHKGVRWVHDYHEACMDKVERFIKGELGRSPSIN